MKWQRSPRNARPAGRAPLVMVVVVAILAAGAIALAGNDNGDNRSDRSGAERAAKRNCPEDPLRLPGDALAPAVRAALHNAEKRLGSDFAASARATDAERFPFESLRARDIKRKCGKKAARRTVVVTLFFPAGKPSASVSQGVVFVSRFESGYDVWTVAH